MTRFTKPRPVSDCVDDALLAPWIVTGRVDFQDARLFAAAVASDPALGDDLAAAEAEREAVVALNEAAGRPSPRAMLALFAAIDEGEDSVRPANVTPLTFDRSRGSSPRNGELLMCDPREKVRGRC